MQIIELCIVFNLGKFDVLNYLYYNIIILSQIHYIVTLISFLSCSHKTHDRKKVYLFYILSYLHPSPLIRLSI